MKAKTLFIMVLAPLPMYSAHASDHIPQAVIRTATQYLPDFKPEHATPSRIPGLFTLEYGPNIIYMSADGRYLVRGDVIDLIEGINVTDVARNKLRIDAVESLGEDSMIVFSPEEVKGTITVFTDITCPYCAKLHREVGQLNDNGIKVRYLAFPRVGVPSSVADDMASVWCADDPRQALTDAKAGLGVDPKRCPNPVQEHYDMGNKVGVNGTPAIVLEDGNLLGGYIPYLRLTDAAQQAHDQVSQ
jgi:thiol:disulfide interchange protein DsbC